MCTQECSCRYSKISYKKIYNHFFLTDIKNKTLEFITFLHQTMHVFTLPNRYMFKRLFNSQRDRPRFFPDRNQINEISTSTKKKTWKI